LLVATLCLVGLGSAPSPAGRDAGQERHLLYVAVPGIRNYVEHGGLGILVFDMDDGHRFVRRIPTFDVKANPQSPQGGEPPEPIKGIAASAATGRLYVSTPIRIVSIDLKTDEIVWNRPYEGGCDRLAISPDGKILYAPSFEGPHWNVIDARTGERIKKIETNSGAHNTIYGPDGKRVYLAGLRSPWLAVADARRHALVEPVGPFSNVIRPFTINAGQTLCFVNVNDLLGFEVGDLKTGKMLHRVEVAGYEKGPVKRHGCPSHGIGLTPDEKELWLADAANSAVHIFDNTVMPPRQVASIKLRDQPGWITFSLDGMYAYPSTGDVIDVRARRIVAGLQDETGRPVQSEKLVEIVIAGGEPKRASDQFGLGRARK
jgi:DNA-binding beta-propeller fold protein YncE